MQRKLVLFDVNGEPVGMSRPLKSLLDDGLPNGGTVTLKYVCWEVLLIQHYDSVIVYQQKTVVL